REVRVGSQLLRAVDDGRLHHGCLWNLFRLESPQTRNLSLVLVAGNVKSIEESMSDGGKAGSARSHYTYSFLSHGFIHPTSLYRRD
ncbi:hypothetical protein PMAYCL1PPCAC_33116, partial [Pristionchus mayeri]